LVRNMSRLGDFARTVILSRQRQLDVAGAFLPARACRLENIRSSPIDSAGGDEHQNAEAEKEHGCPPDPGGAG
jgi:hypothetical protein